MATAITSTNGGIAVCNEALTMLRQDDVLSAGQDGSLPATGVLNQKLWSLYDSARTMVLDAYGWDCVQTSTWDRENIAAWPTYLRTAFVASLVRELAIPVTGRMGDLDAFAKLYEMKLQVAKRKDFADAIAAERAKTTGRNDLALEVYSMLIGEVVSYEKVPWSWSEFKNRVNDAVEGARNEVLLAKDWNFAHAKVEFTCGDYPKWVNVTEGMFPEMVKIRTVKDCMGWPIGSWRVSGNLIEANEPISSVEYTKDVKDLKRWTPLVKRALIACILRDMAGSIEIAKMSVETLHQLYQNKLAEAAMHDACETRPGADCWGRNEYADRIRCGNSDCRRRY